MQRVTPQGAVRGSEHVMIVRGKCVAYLGEQCLAVNLVPENMTERYGVGGIAGEVCLVDVEAYADDGTGDVCAFDVVLDEDAAQLVVPVVDVVGPLDAYVVGIAAQYLTECYGDELAEDKLLGRRYVRRLEGEGEEEVAPGSRLPHGAALPTPCSLMVGGDEGEGAVGGALTGIPVGRVRLGKVDAVNP